jgi:hypothetical protein
MGLSRRAQQLPLTAISVGLQVWEQTRGLREFAWRRGNEALQIAAHTPLGRLLPPQVHDDDADAEAARIVAEAREATRPHVVRDQPDGKTASTVTPPRKPEPVITEAAREVGAPGAVTEEVEKVAEQLHVPTPETRDELPIPDFDNISLGSLRARLKKLTVEQLVVLREWEQAHANRLPVITSLDNRIAKVTAESQGSEPGSGSSAGRSQSDVGAAGTDYPDEAKRAERAAEDEGGTLRV